MSPKEQKHTNPPPQEVRCGPVRMDVDSVTEVPRDDEGAEAFDRAMGQFEKGLSDDSPGKGSPPKPSLSVKSGTSQGSKKVRGSESRLLKKATWREKQKSRQATSKGGRPIQVTRPKTQRFDSPANPSGHQALVSDPTGLLARVHAAERERDFYRQALETNRREDGIRWADAQRHLAWNHTAFATIGQQRAELSDLGKRLGQTMGQLHEASNLNTQQLAKISKLSKQVVDLREHNHWLCKNLMRILTKYPHDSCVPEIQAYFERWYPKQWCARGYTHGPVSDEQCSAVHGAREPSVLARNGDDEPTIHDTSAKRVHEGAAAGGVQ